MNIRPSSLFAACFAFILAGCQVVSGLTGVDLDGSGKDAGPSNVCEDANQKLKTCAGSLGAISLADACNTKREKCEAACVLGATCVAIKESGKAFNACLAACR